MSIFAVDSRASMYALKKAGIQAHGMGDLVSGYYELKTKHGWKPVRIFKDAPLDPVTRDVLDRSHVWQAIVDHKDVDPYDIWPYCCARPISRAVYFDLVTLTPVG